MLVSSRKKKRRNCWSCWSSPLLLLCVYQRQRHLDMEKYILTFVRGSGSVWVHLSTILRVQVHWSKILLVQVRFGFTKMKRFIRVYSSGSGSVRHPGCNLSRAVDDVKFWLLCVQSKRTLKHFFESVELTFLYARCKLCFNHLNKKTMLENIIIFHINLFKRIIAFLIYCMYCIVFKNLFAVLMYKVLQKILRKFFQLKFSDWRLFAHTSAACFSLLIFSRWKTSTIWPLVMLVACSASSKCTTRISLRLDTQIV